MIPLSGYAGNRFHLAPRGTTELHQADQADDQHAEEEEQICPGAWSPRKLSPDIADERLPRSSVRSL